MVYARKGAMRFLSHLDLMRTVFRGFMRANVPIQLSQGFSPHQQIAFGPPLSVGMEGECEFLDFCIQQFSDLKKMRNDIECSFHNILEIKDIHYFRRSSDLLVHEIDLIAYSVSISQSIVSQSDIDTILARDEMIVERVKENSRKKMNVRPHIRKAAVRSDNGRKVLDLEIVSVGGGFAKPYEALQGLFAIDDREARAFRVSRVNMFATASNKKVV